MINYSKNTDSHPCTSPRRIILLHFGLITFRFHFGNPKTPHFHDFRTQRMWQWLPRPIFFIFGDARIPYKIQETIQNHVFKSYYFVKFRKGIRIGHFFGKDERRQIPTICLTSCWKYWIRGQYLLENMKWNSGNMGSSELCNFETKKPRNFETKKLWNQETSKPSTQEAEKQSN